MKVLIPILSRQEDQKEFLDEATRDAHEIYLLAVIDSEEMAGKFSFVSGDMRQAAKTMESIQKAMARKRKEKKEVFDITEWGNTLHKLENIYRLKEIDEIVFQRQNNHWYQEFVKSVEEAGLKYREV